LTAVAQTRSSGHAIPQITFSGGDEEVADPRSEKLSDSLKRVVATGLDSPEANDAICAAIRAGEIPVRRRVEKVDKDGRVVFTHCLQFRARFLKSIFRQDLDFDKSLFAGRCEKENYSLGPLFRLKQVELEIDAVKTLCFMIRAQRMGLKEAGPFNNSSDSARLRTNVSESRPEKQRATGEVASPLDDATRDRPARKIAERAINHLYPNGVPDDLTNKALFDRVDKYFKGLNPRPRAVSKDTILRASGRRKERSKSN
jgi:hypothetical protein